MCVQQYIFSEYVRFVPGLHLPAKERLRIWRPFAQLVRRVSCFFRSLTAASIQCTMPEVCHDNLIATAAHETFLFDQFVMPTPELLVEPLAKNQPTGMSTRRMVSSGPHGVGQLVESTPLVSHYTAAATLAAHGNSQ